MINFLPDTIKTFSNQSQQTVGALIKSIKADKTQVSEIVKSLSTFSAGADYAPLNINPRDLIELKYTIPNYGSGTKVTAGTFRTALATNVITSSFTTVNTSIAVGNLVKVYNPTFPETYFVDVVTAANTTTFTVSDTISNTDVVGVGLSVDVISEKSTAFLNNQNYNIVRYFNSSSAKYDGYKAFAVKIVMLASNYYLVPRVSEYRAIAVSA